MIDGAQGPGVIALIGPMAAGKSTVGSRLAEQLNREFIDLDAEVERRAGRTVAEIFDEQGEQAFRTLESEALAEVLSRTGAVLGCGGGVVVDPSNLTLLEGARVVYLEVDASTAAARVADRGSRPLLSGEDVAADLAGLIESRRDAYRSAADVVVDAARPVDEVVRRILDELEVRP